MLNKADFNKDIVEVVKTNIRQVNSELISNKKKLNELSRRQRVLKGYKTVLFLMIRFLEGKWESSK